MHTPQDILMMLLVNEYVRAIEMDRGREKRNTQPGIPIVIGMRTGCEVKTLDFVERFCGNIDSLIRRGWVIEEDDFMTIDSMKYTYNAGTSMLRYIDDLTDDSESPDAQVKGFTAINSEYGYDAYGSTTDDVNHGISGGIYNFLKMPEQLTISGSTIKHYYAGAGERVCSSHRDGSWTRETEHPARNPDSNRDEDWM